MFFFKLQYSLASAVATTLSFPACLEGGERKSSPAKEITAKRVRRKTTAKRGHKPVSDCPPPGLHT